MNRIYYIRRFCKVPPLERKLFILSLFWLSVMKIVVLVFPFKAYLFFSKRDPKIYLPSGTFTPIIKMALKSQRRALRLLPWGSNCMVKSSSMKAILSSLGIPCDLAFSVSLIGHSIQHAHVYLKIHDQMRLFERPHLHEVLCMSPKQVHQ